MKKSILSVAALALLFVASCGDENTSDVVISDTLQLAKIEDVSSVGQRNCQAMEVLALQLSKDPKMAARVAQIEEFTYQFENYMANKGKPGGGGDPGPTPYTGIVTIPVYVHVIYDVTKPAQNISDAQIQSQIDVLNEDFRKLNTDVTYTPSEFAGFAVDSEIRFTLAGITRKASTVVNWGTNDAMKFSSNGGVDAINPSKNLNIWVCNISSSILGYAQFPGGAAATDGVVVGPNFFGRTGYLSAPFNKGRTATHEVGHWLNLRHIWGDGPCRFDDYVADTPNADAPNYGCPSYPTISCRNNNMTMNYMDYTDDACMFMFTDGQKTRMRALFASGGARQSFVTP